MDLIIDYKTASDNEFSSFFLPFVSFSSSSDCVFLHRPDSSSLLSLALTCKKLSQVTIPVLWRHVRLEGDTDRIVSFLSTFLRYARPQDQPHRVHSLSIFGKGKPSCAASISQVLEKHGVSVPYLKVAAEIKSGSLIPTTTPFDSWLSSLPLEVIGSMLLDTLACSIVFSILSPSLRMLRTDLTTLLLFRKFNFMLPVGRQLNELRHLQLVEDLNRQEVDPDVPFYSLQADVLGQLGPLPHLISVDTGNCTIECDIFSHSMSLLHRNFDLRELRLSIRGAEVPDVARGLERVLLLNPSLKVLNIKFWRQVDLISAVVACFGEEARVKSRLEKFILQSGESLSFHASNLCLLTLMI